MEISGNGSRRITDARFVGGNQAVNPNPLVGYVANPIPGFPNLADIEIHDLVTSIETSNFTVVSNGDFNTTVTTTVTEGMLVVTPLGGSQTSTDLTGTVGPPNAISGNLDYGSNTLTLDSPQSATFPFTDTATGISGSFTITGLLYAEKSCVTAQNYCSPSNNSTGAPALMGYNGNTTIWSNNLVLTAGPVPQQPGLFFYGPNSSNVPFGNGTRCVGGSLVRLPVSVASGGQMTSSIDYDTLPGAGQIVSGDTKYFQAWYRDPAAGGSFYNLSDGMSVQFCP
jgi:hypothetical protein